MDKEFNIEARKLFSTLNKESERLIKPTNCILCGKNMQGTCNSHSIPIFILKNISKNGFVYHLNGISQLDGILGQKIGINKAGTFHYLCTECDKKIFDDYEDENKLMTIYKNYTSKSLRKDDKKALLKIILKSFLKEYHTKLLDLHRMTVITHDLCEMYNLYNKNKGKTEALNVRDYKEEIDSCITHIYSDCDVKIYDMILLPYTVSFASQIVIALPRDMDGEIINDIYDHDENYRIQSLCWCVFPLREKTLIFILGLPESAERYKTFKEKYNKLNKPNRLKLLQTILFEGTEEIYLSENLYNILKNKEDFLTMASKGVSLNKSKIENTLMLFKSEMNICYYKTISENIFERKFSKKALESKV